MACWFSAWRFQRGVGWGGLMLWSHTFYGHRMLTRERSTVCVCQSLSGSFAHAWHNPVSTLRKFNWTGTENLLLNTRHWYITLRFSMHSWFSALDCTVILLYYDAVSNSDATQKRNIIGTSNVTLKTFWVNLLKMKRNLLYIRCQPVPRSKHFPPRF
jgi:hypothetical protein